MSVRLVPRNVERQNSRNFALQWLQDSGNGRSQRWALGCVNFTPRPEPARTRDDATWQLIVSLLWNGLDKPPAYCIFIWDSIPLIDFKKSLKFRQEAQPYHSSQISIVQNSEVLPIRLIRITDCLFQMIRWFKSNDSNHNKLIFGPTNEDSNHNKPIFRTTNENPTLKLLLLLLAA